jgi:lariat debranching enzyme
LVHCHNNNNSNSNEEPPAITIMAYAPTTAATRNLKVAVQGCCHGSLTAIYDSIAEFQRQKNERVDLLLLCGDFQALRSRADFASLAVPQKYQALGTFHQYYSGEKVAPVLTIVIGGNHEASNYMWELYHGGWLAPNIYYLGAAGSVLVDGLRIAGASGIYKRHDYNKGMCVEKRSLS